MFSLELIVVGREGEREREFQRLERETLELILVSELFLLESSFRERKRG